MLVSKHTKAQENYMLTISIMRNLKKEKDCSLISPIIGAECKNCHMPGKFYMGNDYRQDHNIRLPHPDLFVKYGVPMHVIFAIKISPQCAADALIKNYGRKRKYHFAEDLIPGSKLDVNSE
jgi:hypothetical protein